MCGSALLAVCGSALLAVFASELFSCVVCLCIATSTLHNPCILLSFASGVPLHSQVYVSLHAQPVVSGSAS